MDWSSIVYVAIGAGGGAALGVLLSALVQKLRGKSGAIDKNDKAGVGLRSALVAGMIVLGSNVLSMYYKNMTLPRIIPMDDSEIIESLPIYGIIKEQSPKDYKRLIEVVDKDDRNNRVTPETIHKIRQILFRLIAERTREASADNIRRLEKVTIRQFTTYKKEKPSICTLIVNNEPFPDLTDLLSEEDKKTEQDIAVKLFTDAPRDPEFVTDLGEGKRIFEAMLPQLISDSGITNMRPDITDKGQNISEHEALCDLLISLSKKKLELSDNDLINVSDYLLSL